jgi:hypothetical protein
MVRTHHTALDDANAKESKKEVGSLKYDLNGALTSNELYRPVWIYGKPNSAPGLSSDKTTRYITNIILKDTLLLEQLKTHK